MSFVGNRLFGFTGPYYSVGVTDGRRSNAYCIDAVDLSLGYSKKVTVESTGARRIFAGSAGSINGTPIWGLESKPPEADENFEINA